MDVYEIAYNNQISLRFTMEVFGSRPTSGYALFIALHGGGGSTTDGAAVNGFTGGIEGRKRSNNGAWYNMSSGLYRYNFKGGNPNKLDVGLDGAIYLAPRGLVQPMDTWNLHFQPENYMLMDKLLSTLTQSTGSPSVPLVGSNKSFVTGFSAGGDGAYQWANMITDRFAAANASAGHPNQCLIDNLSSLPFRSQVGEMDPSLGQSPNKIRALAVVTANGKLDSLKSQAQTKGAPNTYIHHCFVYAQGQNGTTTVNSDHNNWEWAECTPWYSYQCLNQNILSSWLSNQGASTRDSTLTNSGVIPWMSNLTRNAYPSPVVWNLDSRPTKPDTIPNAQIGKFMPKRYFYWLYLRNTNPTDIKLIRATHSSASSGRRIDIDQPSVSVTFLLNEQMFTPLNAPIDVYCSGVKAGTVTPLVSDTIRQQTLSARGDVNLQFSAVIYLDRTPVIGPWLLKTTDSLDNIELTPIPSLL